MMSMVVGGEVGVSKTADDGWRNTTKTMVKTCRGHNSERTPMGKAVKCEASCDYASESRF